MKKSELVKHVANLANISNKDAHAAVTAVFDVLTDALVHKDTVSIENFGSFSVTTRAPRTGRNPATGEALSIPAKDAVKFKVARYLKDAVAK